MKKIKTTLNILTILYFILLTWLLFFYSFKTYSRAENTQIQINLIPFKTISVYIDSFHDYYHYHGISSWLANIFGNVLIFIPTGLILPIYFPFYSSLKLLAISTITLVLIESVQYLYGLGIFDIDDIMLNFMGILIGYLSVKSIIICKK